MTKTKNDDWFKITFEETPYYLEGTIIPAPVRIIDAQSSPDLSADARAQCLESAHDLYLHCANKKKLKNQK